MMNRLLKSLALAPMALAILAADPALAFSKFSEKEYRGSPRTEEVCRSICPPEWERWPHPPRRCDPPLICPPEWERWPHPPRRCDPAWCDPHGVPIYQIEWDL